MTSSGHTYNLKSQESRASQNYKVRTPREGRATAAPLLAAARPGADLYVVLGISTVSDARHGPAVFRSRLTWRGSVAGNQHAPNTRGGGERTASAASIRYSLVARTVQSSGVVASPRGGDGEANTRRISRGVGTTGGWSSCPGVDLSVVLEISTVPSPSGAGEETNTRLNHDGI